MQFLSTQNILIGQAVVMVLLIAVSIFLFAENRRHETVINNQGSVIKLLVETPEINQLLARELQKLKGK